MLQDEIFKNSESDNWFLRNKDVIISLKSEDDICTNLISDLPDKNNIKSVLELGSSNGYRLNFLKNILPECKRFVGVDLSNLAVEDGKTRYNLEMYHNSLLDFKSEEKFDLVIVNFVLHWIDRKNIFKCIANIDDLLNSNNNETSFLCIGDFSPDYPCKRRYHHRPEENVYTYKTDYKKVFTSLNTYKLISEKTFNHDNKSLVSSNTTRASACLLRKNTDAYYHEI